VGELGKKLLYNLRFDDIEDRHERIAEAYKETFKWIYGEVEAEGKPWTSFTKWLEGQSDLYWITGKAGSGKSTLMKYLYNNPLTLEHLQEWASPCSLLTAAFFFWNSGSKMQMSKMGLLQSLLFELLSKQPILIPIVLPERWEVYSLFGEDTRPWSWPELVKALKLLIAQDFLAICFFIDGLDEFDGDHSELVELLHGISTSSNVKICVSSRPWILFEDAFKSQPSLMLQDLTYPDIQLFVCTKFRENAGFIELEERESEYASKLLEDIAKKASGVFLWVNLVVTSLLNGLTNGDRVSDLQRRLDLLPPDLEDLFQRILASLDPFYLEHASQIFQINRAAIVQPTLLCLSLADEEDEEYVFRSLVEPMSEKEKAYRAKNMKRRLNSRCKGFLEVAPPLTSGTRKTSNTNNSGSNNALAPEDFQPASTKYELDANLKVAYLHRTVKDFLDKPDVWNKLLAASKPSFNPYRSLCSSFLLQLKCVHPDALTLSGFWDLVTWCIEYAAKIEAVTGDMQVRLLDELERVAAELTSCPGPEDWTFLDLHTFNKRLHNNSHWTNTRLPWILGSSFLHLAALCNLDKYVSIKLGPGCFYLPDPNSTPLLDSAIADFNTFIDYKDKPYCSTLQVPFRTIQILLEKGADPNHVFRNRTPWQILLSQREVRGQPSDWFKIIETFIECGADPKIIDNSPVWCALRKKDPAETMRLEAIMATMAKMRNLPVVEKRFFLFNRRYRGRAVVTLGLPAIAGGRR
jgi:NACHT domain